jgi:hypothetical protein
MLNVEEGGSYFLRSIEYAIKDDPEDPPRHLIEMIAPWRPSLLTDPMLL